jgi:hypothetical protein
LGLGGWELFGVDAVGVEAEPPASCVLDSRRKRPWLGTRARTGPNRDCRRDCEPALRQQGQNRTQQNAAEEDMSVGDVVWHAYTGPTETAGGTVSQA